MGDRQTGRRHWLCLCCWSHPKPLGSCSAGLEWALGGRSPHTALSWAQGEAAAVLALAGQAPTGCGAAPSCSGEMAPCALVLYFHGKFVSFFN